MYVKKRERGGVRVTVCACVSKGERKRERKSVCLIGTMFRVMENGFELHLGKV